MKLLFDQNISYRILKFLSSDYTGSTSVKGEGLIDYSDQKIWEFAKEHNFIIVTQDSDFNDLNILYGFPPKIIWIRTGNLSTETIGRILNEYSSEIQKFQSSQSLGCFEIFSIS